MSKIPIIGIAEQQGNLLFAGGFRYNQKYSESEDKLGRYIMTLIVQSSSEDVISFPGWLMKVLNLQEGDEIKTVIDGQMLRITPLDQFLALRGVLKNDREFDAAIGLLNQAWQEWKTPDSV